MLVLQVLGGSVVRQSPDGAKEQRKFSIDTADIVAVAVMILAIGAVLVALIVAIELGLGRVPTKEGSTIIVACVGGSAISGVVAALFTRRKKRYRVLVESLGTPAILPKRGHPPDKQEKSGTAL